MCILHHYFTESAALSSIWQTDDAVRRWLTEHGRNPAVKMIKPLGTAYYDRLIEIDLSKAEAMIGLPFHPSNGITISKFQENMADILREIEKEAQQLSNGLVPFTLTDKMRNGSLYIQQALISGCAGGMFENIAATADILKGHVIPGRGVGLGINPASQQIYTDLLQKGIAGQLLSSGAVIRPAICGPCFGVMDAPAHNSLSIRHVTRNYPNRDGSIPGVGQMAAVALMDARSIAATVKNNGRITAATDLEIAFTRWEYEAHPEQYRKQVYHGHSSPEPAAEVKLGSNIGSWPEFPPLAEHLLLFVAGSYDKPLTTDELVPSGETSSYRSNPHKLAEYTLKTKDPDYVAAAKEIRLLAGRIPEQVLEHFRHNPKEITVGSVIAAPEIGDGSSREHAASCQKVLGGWANIAADYATKRYLSNLINWGIVPFLTDMFWQIKKGACLYVPDLRRAITEGRTAVEAWIAGADITKIELKLPQLTEEEREILLSGCLINYYRQ